MDDGLSKPGFDACAEVASLDARSSTGLAACDCSTAQTFVFPGEGAIVPASATGTCLTLAEDTRTGRSDANQV